MQGPISIKRYGNSASARFYRSAWIWYSEIIIGGAEMKRAFLLLIGISLALSACAMAPVEPPAPAEEAEHIRPAISEDTPLPLSLDEFYYQGVMVGETTGEELTPLLGEPDNITSGIAAGQSEVTGYGYEYGDEVYVSAALHGNKIRAIYIEGSNAAPFSRDIKCGDSLDAIIAKFPTGSITEPKNWYDADYYPRAELTDDGRQLVLQMTQDAPVAYLYFDNGELLTRLEILATAPDGLIDWQLREKALREEIPFLGIALKAGRTIDDEPLDDATCAHYQQLLAAKQAELTEAQEQIARLRAESGDSGPVTVLTQAQQGQLEALLTDFSTATAQAWLEAMLPAFHVDGDYPVTVDWLDDSKAQGWVLAKAYYYELYRYFYVLADGQLRFMGAAERDLGLDTSNAPAELVIIDSGDRMRINGTHNFPKRISAYWDRPDLLAEGFASDQADPITGKTATIIHSEYWLSVGEGELYGQNKSATLMEIMLTEEGLTLVYAHKPGDQLYVGGQGIPNMIMEGEAANLRLTIPEARLGADFSVSGQGLPTDVQAEATRERGVTISFQLPAGQDWYYRFHSEDVGNQTRNEADARTHGYVRFRDYQ